MENIETGLLLLIIGFTVVMSVLYLLYLVMRVKGAFFAPKNNPRPLQKENLNAPLKNETLEAPVAACKSIEEGESTQNVLPEVVAAITAAIVSCLDSPPAALHIIPEAAETRTTAASPWPLTGRKNLMEKRQGIALLRRERRK